VRERLLVEARIAASIAKLPDLLLVGAKATPHQVVDCGKQSC
jgi:hypothetical protein